MKTTFLSPDEKRIYTMAYVDGLREAKEMVNSYAKKMDHATAAFHCVVEIRDTILSRINQLEKEK